MPEWILRKISDALNNNGKPLKDSKILMLGISYKKNVDDIRESPSVKLMELLRAKGCVISYSDPYIPVFPKMREHRFDLQSVKINVDILSQVDCVILATDHDDFDYDFIQSHSKLIIDTRGRYRKKYNNVVRC